MCETTKSVRRKNTKQRDNKLKYSYSSNTSEASENGPLKMYKDKH